MIPKSKLAILIGGLKPKGDDVAEEKAEGESDIVSQCAERILKAVKAGDADALSDALHVLVDHIKEEDEEQDAEAESEEPEEKGY